ncbi:MAG TPA: hypothetical protein EYP14_10290, partial [Planctomycetaceae bacterium]|nr:hypothetical protein [Planctomycetaceae bacterium]
MSPTATARGSDAVKAYWFQRKDRPGDTYVLVWATGDEVELSVPLVSERLTAMRPFGRSIELRVKDGRSTVTVSERMYLAFAGMRPRQVAELLARARVAVRRPPAEQLEPFRTERFTQPAPQAKLTHIWGDKPAVVELNSVELQAGEAGRPGLRFKAKFSDKTPRGLSYWSWRLEPPVPLVPELRRIAVRIKTNVPVSIKIGISPFGFIYHGPIVQPAEKWQTLALEDAYGSLSRWCRQGGRRPEDGWVRQVILAVHTRPGQRADLAVDHIALEGPRDAAAAVSDAALARKVRRI